MVRVKNISFNPKGCIDMTKDEFKARLKSVNPKLINDAWYELQKEVKKHKPVATKKEVKEKPQASKRRRKTNVKEG